MFFWNSLAFSVIQRMLAIWSLVPLRFLKPAWTSGSSRFTYCWSLAWRILSITLLACEMSAIGGSKNVQFLRCVCVCMKLPQYSNILYLLKTTKTISPRHCTVFSVTGLHPLPGCHIFICWILTAAVLNSNHHLNSEWVKVVSGGPVWFQSCAGTRMHTSWLISAGGYLMMENESRFSFSLCTLFFQMATKLLGQKKKNKTKNLGRKDPLEEEMATHSSILAWRVPGTEEPGGLQSTGSHYTHT